MVGPGKKSIFLWPKEKDKRMNRVAKINTQCGYKKQVNQSEGNKKR